MYKSVIIDTVLASIVCAVFQGIVSFVIFQQNNVAGAYPPQYLLISSGFSFAATFIPLLGYNIVAKRRKK